MADLSVNDASQKNPLASLGLLASALACREVAVDFAGNNETCWTNGKTIFVSADANRQLQIVQVCVQSALLACNSFERQILKQLAHRPRLTERFLCVESQRALAELNDLLPPAMDAFIVPELAAMSTSPQGSLEIAKSALALEKPGENFGQIRVKQLLSSEALEGGAASAGQHIPRKQSSEPLQEFVDDPAQDEDPGEDFASSPVGGGGGIGKLLQKLFQMVRNVKSGGSPGADAPTHWTRSGTRAGVRAVRSSANAQTIEDAFGKGSGVHYPEWNMHQGCYRVDWCTVEELEPATDTESSVAWLEGYGLRKPLSRLGMELDRFHRQSQGDDIDIDAAIEAQVEMTAGSYPDECVYVESQRHRRDLSVLVLLDISGSVSQASASGGSVHQLQRAVAASLVTVSYEVGDRVALYAFHSQGRGAVHLAPVKRFDETLDGKIMNRLYSLKPGAYSRLGAAIRHGSTELINNGGTSRMLLVVLSDGLAYDHGYEPAYAAADVRQSLAEARRDGVGCLCLSVGADTETEALQSVFGSAAHAQVANPNQLGRIIGPLFRAALQTAESQRRVA